MYLRPGLWPRNPRPTVHGVPPGSFQNGTTNGTCTACPAGSASLRPGAVNSSDCDCEAQFQGNGGLSCTPCPPNYIKRDPGNGECQLNQCQDGEDISPETQLCECAKGFDRQALNATHFECRACPPGKYKDFVSNSGAVRGLPRRPCEFGGRRGFRARLRVFGRHWPRRGVMCIFLS